MSFTKKTTALCRRCGGETKQIVRGGRSVPLSAYLEEPGEEGPRLKEYQTDLDYELYECCSCEYIDLRSSRDLSGASGFTVRFHPGLTTRAVPGWRRELPPSFAPILDEVYAALGTDSRVLALMGVRAVLDIVLRDKAGGIVSFRGGLLTLENEGLLRESDRELLWSALIADDETHSEARRPPTLETMKRVMDVLEELLHASYVRRNVRIGSTIRPDRRVRQAPLGGRPDRRAPRSL